jgi:RimJ/RimL family protein N-acetyltransferase
LRAIYLTGERVYLRALVESDKQQASAWMPGSFPANSVRAEAFFKESVKLWQRKNQLVICRTDSDEIVGGVSLWNDPRHAHVRFTIAPRVEDAGSIRGDVIRLMVPWLRDELDVITTSFDLAADDTEAIAAAEELGLLRAVRLREWIARPGHRVDLYVYQAVNYRWVKAPASDGSTIHGEGQEQRA